MRSSSILSLGEKSALWREVRKVGVDAEEVGAVAAAEGAAGIGVASFGFGR